jgi:hypothetical protein
LSKIKGISELEFTSLSKIKGISELKKLVSFSFMPYNN